MTWNVFNRSPSPGAILRETAEIAAYQELTDAHLAALRTLGGTTTTALDFIEGDQTTFLGVRTADPPLEVQIAGINRERALSPSFVGRKMKWVESIEALHLRLDLADRPISLVNLHLSCAVGPSLRRAELDRILGAFALEPAALVVGDFNSFASPWTAPLLGPAFGYRPQDYLVAELTGLDRAMAARGFRRLTPRWVTLPRLRLRLDHAFGRGLATARPRLGTERHGSDHLPLFVELKPA